jgi:hypothetical protein
MRAEGCGLWRGRDGRSSNKEARGGGRGGLQTGVHTVGGEQPPAHAPQSSISLPRTGYLGNLCSLIIILQRVPLILPKESARCQTHRVLVNSISAALHLRLAPCSLAPFLSDVHPVFASHPRATLRVEGSQHHPDPQVLAKDLGGGGLNNRRER